MNLKHLVNKLKEAMVPHHVLTDNSGDIKSVLMEEGIETCDYPYDVTEYPSPFDITKHPPAGTPIYTAAMPDYGAMPDPDSATEPPYLGIPIKPHLPRVLERCDLEYREGGSDKVYHMMVEETAHNEATVHYAYGRRGAILIRGHKAIKVTTVEAGITYRNVLDSKTAKGYVPMMGMYGDPWPGKRPSLTFAPSGSAALPDPEWPITDQDAVLDRLKPDFPAGPQLLNSIEKAELDHYIRKNGFCMQEKFDGKRLWLIKKDGVITAMNRKMKVIQCPPEYKEALDCCFGPYSFTIDGEACGPVFRAFDILELEATDCFAMAYEERLSMLGMLIRSAKPKQKIIELVYTAYTAQEKQYLLRDIEQAGGEGVVIKPVIAPYTTGRPNSNGPQLKYKMVQSASCIVTKVNAKRSVELGLITDHDGRSREELTKVGNVTIPPNYDIPKKDDIVEVRYLYAYKGGSLYQPVYLGARDDITKNECTLDQLKYKPT